MQAPTYADFGRLKHVLRYVKGTSDFRLSLCPDRVDYGPESLLSVLVFADSDWAGCTDTRKSTSGCVVTVAGVCVSHFARTQQTVALSSAEAELYAMCSATCEGLAIHQFLKECGLSVGIVS